MAICPPPVLRRKSQLNRQTAREATREKKKSMRNKKDWTGKGERDVYSQWQREQPEELIRLGLIQILVVWCSVLMRSQADKL